jgi:hypothetical protein
MVFDRNFVGMSVLPPEGDAVLSVHPDAVAARLVALQQLEAIAGWNHEIIKPGGGIEQFELPLDDSPQLTRHASGSTRVSLAKQIIMI